MTTIDLRLPRLHAGQELVLAEAGRRNVVQCGRRWGKTTLGVDQLLDTALRGLPAAWFAPTYRMQSEVWRTLLQVTADLRQAKLVQVNRSERRMEFPTGGTIELWSLDDPDAGRGRAYATIVVDEAAYVRGLMAAWNASLRAMLTDYAGTAWFLSTPRGMDDFHTMFLRGQQAELWQSWRMPTTTNPHIDPAEVAIAERELPPDVFAQEYLGIPSPDAANPFGLAAIDAACVLEEPTLGTTAGWGVDLAKYHDWTVALGLDAAGECTHMQRWQSDWRNTTARLDVMLQGVPSLIDSTGVGDPIVEQLARANPFVQGFRFTSTSRQQLLDGLASALQRRAIRVPRAIIRDELLAFRFDAKGGRVRYAAPDGVHDDAVMALALAVRCMDEHGPSKLTLDVGGLDLDTDDDDWS